MSYANPSPHEIRISQRLQKVAAKLDKLLKKETGGECDFILCVNSKSERNTVLSSEFIDAPVGSYAASSDRMTSALIMTELLAKWQLNGDLPPVHEWEDAAGRTLSEILGAGPN